MKRIVLTCDVRDEDADEIVGSAREALPTWKVKIQEVDCLTYHSYKVGLRCQNCQKVFGRTYPLGKKVPREETCPYCRCKTGTGRSK